VSKRTCPACNATYVRGYRVWFASRTGLKPATVCGTCKAAGITIVQDASADPVKCVSCATGDAVLCMVCVAKRIASGIGAGFRKASGDGE